MAVMLQQRDTPSMALALSCSDDSFSFHAYKECSILEWNVDTKYMFSYSVAYIVVTKVNVVIL